MKRVPHALWKRWVFASCSLPAPGREWLQDLVVLELQAQNLRLSRELEAEKHRGQDMQRALKQAQVLEGMSALIDLDLEPEEMTVAYHHPRVPQPVLDLHAQLPTLSRKSRKTLAALQQGRISCR